MAETKTTVTKTTKTPTGLHAKLNQARILLGETKLTKTGQNSYSHYNYFQLKDFLPEVNKIFNNIGLHSHFEIKPTVIAEKSYIKDDVRYVEPIINTLAQLTITDIETNDTEVYSMEVQPLEVLKQQNSYQAAGGRSTYYKRYLYRDALEIEEDDDIEPLTGSKEAIYQPAPTQQVTPYSFQAPQAAPIQQAIVEQNIGTMVEVTPQGDVKPLQTAPTGNPDELISQQSKEEVMTMIISKGLNGFEVISNYCQQNGIASPSELKESDKAGLLAYVGTL